MPHNKYFLLASLMLCWLITTATTFLPSSLPEPTEDIVWDRQISVIDRILPGKSQHVKITPQQPQEIVWKVDPQTDTAVPHLPLSIAAPTWAKNAVQLKPSAILNKHDAPMIAIIIDDMGISKARSERAANLPAPMTLSYLPYSKDLKAQTASSRQKGHELMVHMPMEAHTHDVDHGPLPLMSDLSGKELLHNLRHNLDGFDGYVGINNHMGSKLSQDADALALIMKELKKRGLLYIDSRTTPYTLGESTAREYGLPTTRRDVFLDHEATPEFVAGALAKLEQKALENGTAIAIGHPKTVTIDALEKWIPEARKKGFYIVPASEIVKRRMYDETHPTKFVSAEK